VAGVPPLFESPDVPECSPDLLAQRDRELHDEQERLRLDAEAEVFAEKAERELRASPVGEIPANAVRLNLPANSNQLAHQDPSRRALFR
jgi:hypothetical protein